MIKLCPPFFYIFFSQLSLAFLSKVVTVLPSMGAAEANTAFTEEMSYFFRSGVSLRYLTRCGTRGQAVIYIHHVCNIIDN